MQAWPRFSGETGRNMEKTRTRRCLGASALHQAMAKALSGSRASSPSRHTQTQAQVFSILFTPSPCEHQAITSTASRSRKQALPSGSCSDCLQKIYSIERGRCIGFTSKELTSLGYEFNAEKVQTFPISFFWRSDLLLTCLDPRK